MGDSEQLCAKGLIRITNFTLPAWENSPPTARSVIIANGCGRSKPQQNKNHAMLLTRAGKTMFVSLTVALPAHKTKIVVTIGPAANYFIARSQLKK